MPELDRDTTSTDGKKSKDVLQSTANGSTVFMEDPSEYRPEIKDMALGKDQDDFRVFYKVSRRV